MNEKYNDATINRPDGERPIDAPQIVTNLQTAMQQLRSEKAWHTNERNAITLFKTDCMRIVLIGLHENAALPTHSTPGMISVQILEGLVEFTSDDETVELKAPQLLVLHEHIRHSVKAIKESMLLLTLCEKK